MELEMTRGTLSWRTKLGGMLHHPQEDNAYLRKPNNLVEKVKPSVKYIIIICVDKNLGRLGLALKGSYK